MSTDRLVADLTAAWNSGDIRRIASQYADDAVLVHVLFPDTLRGRAAIAEAEGGMFAAFSDIDWRVSSATAQGDRVALEWEVAATHTSAMPTPAGPLPATGRRIRVRGSSHMHLRDGRIGEEHRYLDGAGMFAQLTG